VCRPSPSSIYPNLQASASSTLITMGLFAGGILEEFGWFGGMLEEFVREKHCSG